MRACVRACARACVRDLYKCILVAIDELCKALRAPERQGAVQILIIIIIIVIKSAHENHCILRLFKAENKNAQWSVAPVPHQGLNNT